jgi:CBS-domain-containing membrane protein
MEKNYATVGGAVMALFGAVAVIRYYLAPWPGADPGSVVGGAIIFLVGAGIVAYGTKLSGGKK